MANKGQKFNKYDVAFRMQVVSEYLRGEGSAKYLAKKYNISRHTVETWIYKYRDTGTLETKSKVGRPRKDEEIDYKERYEILKKYQAFLKARQKKK